MHMLQDLLGSYYGVAFIVVGVGVNILRELTNGPIGEA